MTVIRPAQLDDPTEGPDTVSRLLQAPTIRTQAWEGGTLLTCPAGHGYWHLAPPDPEILAPWVVDHENHQEAL